MNMQVIQGIIDSLNNIEDLYIGNFDGNYFDDGYVRRMYLCDTDLYIYGRSKLSTDDEEECFEVINISKGLKVEIKDNLVVLNGVTFEIKAD
jgi:hypothetical protein